MAGASNRHRLIKIDWREFGVASCPPTSQAGLGLPAGTVSIQNFIDDIVAHSSTHFSPVSLAVAWEDTHFLRNWAKLDSTKRIQRRIWHASKVALVACARGNHWSAIPAPNERRDLYAELGALYLQGVKRSSVLQVP